MTPPKAPEKKAAPGGEAEWAAKPLDPDEWMEAPGAEELPDDFTLELEDGRTLTKADLLEAQKILDGDEEGPPAVSEGAVPPEA